MFPQEISRKETLLTDILTPFDFIAVVVFSPISLPLLLDTSMQGLRVFFSHRMRKRVSSRLFVTPSKLPSIFLLHEISPQMRNLEITVTLK